MTATDIAKSIPQRVWPAFIVPQVVMRIDNRRIGLQRLFLPGPCDPTIEPDTVTIEVAAERGSLGHRFAPAMLW
jgi:hypothetical protein